MKTASPLPRRVLIDALCGADVCWHCRGQGSLLVTGPRDRRVCPMCRGSGLTATKPTTATMRPAPGPF